MKRMHALYFAFALSLFPIAAFADGEASDSLDIGALIQSVFDLINQGKWWMLAAVIIGAAVRLTKPDVRWIPNIDARWRPLVAAGLGVLVGVANKVASGDDLKSSLQYGLSAAVAAMMGHLFGIEVARNGREIGQKKEPSEVVP